MKAKMRVITEGGQWEPTKKGDVFAGKITGRKLVDTSRGWRPIIEIASESTGEVIEVFATNLRLRGLNRVPLGTYVELTYEGDETIKIGRKKQIVQMIQAAIPENVKMGADWSLAEIAKLNANIKTRKAGKTKRVKGK